jgi:hypothetical protein
LRFAATRGSGDFNSDLSDGRRSISIVRFADMRMGERYQLRRPEGRVATVLQTAPEVRRKGMVTVRYENGISAGPDDSFSRRAITRACPWRVIGPRRE